MSKEEPKQEFPKQNIIDNWLEKNGDPEIHKQVEQEAKELCEQETLEEAAREYYKRGQLGFEKAADTERAFLRGGLWQKEQDKKMYSEEDIKSLSKIRNYFRENDKTMFEHFAYSFLNEFIKQLKNK
jgi:hypothetical protein